MSSSDLERLKGMIRARGSLDAPSAVALDPEVRTGETFILTDPGGARAGEPGANVKALLKNKTLVGAITMVWGYDVPLEHGDRFGAWLRDNEAALAAAAPKGVHYRGTYAVFSTTEKRTGNYRTIWAYDSLNALQGMYAAAGGGDDFARLFKQLNDFRDRSRDADRSQEILVPAAAAGRI